MYAVRHVLSVTVQQKSYNMGYTICSSLPVCVILHVALPGDYNKVKPCMCRLHQTAQTINEASSS